MTGLKVVLLGEDFARLTSSWPADGGRAKLIEQLMKGDAAAVPELMRILRRVETYSRGVERDQARKMLRFIGETTWGHFE